MKLDSLDRSLTVNCQLQNVLTDDHSSATKTNSNRRFRRPTTTSKPGKPSPGTVPYGRGDVIHEGSNHFERMRREEKRLKRNDNVEKPEPPYHLHRLPSSAINVPVFSGLVSVSSATNELSTLRDPRKRDDAEQPRRVTGQLYPIHFPIEQTPPSHKVCCCI